nr:cold shock protein 2-like [Lolium perenne]
MKTLADTLDAIGQPLHEEEIISYILAGLGPNYDPLVTSLSVKDDITLDKDSEYGIGNGSSVNFTRRNNQGRSGGQGGQGGQPGHPGGRGNGDGGRGRGQGRGGGGHGRPNQGCGGGNGAGSGASRPICQICKKVGHIALRCYNRFDHAYGGE